MKRLRGWLQKGRKNRREAAEFTSELLPVMQQLLHDLAARYSTVPTGRHLRARLDQIIALPPRRQVESFGGAVSGIALSADATAERFQSQIGSLKEVSTTALAQMSSLSERLEQNRRLMDEATQTPNAAHAATRKALNRVIAALCAENWAA